MEASLKNQNIFLKTVENISKKQTNVQGYILSCEDKEILSKYALLLSKSLICKEKYSDNCSKCNICKRIDNNNYSELKIISPINNVIKKEEVLKLKTEFSSKPVEGNNLVYIINDAELLNSHATNAILKFLEEPEGKIIGIFTTTNINSLYDTIISRCQIIRLNNEDTYNIIEGEDTNYIISFIKLLEDNYEDAMCEYKEKFLKKYETKDKLKKVLNTFLLFYKSCLDYKLLEECKEFKGYSDFIYFRKY